MEPVMHAFRSIFALFAVGLTGIISCGEQVVVRETQAACGNGQLDADEQCDDGNLLNDDACTAACVAARCGDGVTRTDLTVEDEGYEGCDDGNDADEDGCTVACALAVCGDGIVRADIAAGEALSLIHI